MSGHGVSVSGVERPLKARGVVASVQVGRVASLAWRARAVPTAIVKSAVSGPVAVGELGLEGDEQADTDAHGGPDKAVCAYPAEHLPAWERRLGVALPGGAFGENLTVTGMLEQAVNIGDVYEIGSVVMQVSQPRGPCYKLAARWGDRELPAVMARAGTSGFYLRVLSAGQLAAGDTARLVRRGSDVSVAEVMRVTYTRAQPADIDAVLSVPELARRWQRTLSNVRRRAGRPVSDFGGED